VRRILFDNRRAIGVRALVAGRETELRASREVIVCAGAYHSPQLLQISGIGEPTHLASLGVPLVAASPQVGQNLQDHVQARVRFVLNAPLGLNALYHRRARLAWELAKYAFARRGRCMAPPIRTGAFVHSAPGLARPDLQWHFIEFTAPGMGQPPHRENGFWASVCALRPASRGSVRARSADMAQPPAILGRYLSDEADARLTLHGVRLARALAAQPPLARLIAAEADPGPVVEGDAALLEWIRATAVTVYHPVGTCRMGGDAASVVDPLLRVRGVAALRVADASVMPTLVSGNTNAPAIMIGERAAQFLLAG
jgi:choline dehydrogenase